MLCVVVKMWYYIEYYGTRVSTNYLVLDKKHYPTIIYYIIVATKNYSCRSLPRLSPDTPCHCTATAAATWNPIRLAIEGRKVGSSVDGFAVWPGNGTAEGLSKGILEGDNVGLAVGNSSPKPSKDGLTLLVTVAVISFIHGGIYIIVVAVVVIDSGIKIAFELLLSGNNNNSDPLSLTLAMSLSMTSCMEFMAGMTVGMWQWVEPALVWVFVRFVLKVVPGIPVGARQSIGNCSQWSHCFCEE